MAIQIPNHSHCAICSKAIPFVPTSSKDADDRTCSKECASAFVDRQKKAKKNITSDAMNRSMPMRSPVRTTSV